MRPSPTAGHVTLADRRSDDVGHLDHVIALGLADADRLVALGLSCGGFMVKWLVGTSDRFRAAVSENGVTNQVVLAASSLIGVATAQATPGVVDNQATILRIGGSAVTGSDPIPSGRTLTPVQLVTSDPATIDGDGTALSGATPGFRIGRTRVPGTTAEQVTFRINGTVVATTVPDMRATSLQTDAGSFTAVVSTAGGAT